MGHRSNAVLYLFAGKMIRQAAQRHLRDQERAAAADPAFPFWFSDQAAGHACWFIEQLPHVKGPKARTGERIQLEGWQCFMIGNL